MTDIIDQAWLVSACLLPLMMILGVVLGRKIKWTQMFDQPASALGRLSFYAVLGAVVICALLGTSGFRPDPFDTSLTIWASLILLIWFWTRCIRLLLISSG